MGGGRKARIAVRHGGKGGLNTVPGRTPSPALLRRAPSPLGEGCKSRRDPSPGPRGRTPLPSERAVRADVTSHPSRRAGHPLPLERARTYRNLAAGRSGRWKLRTVKTRLAIAFGSGQVWLSVGPESIMEFRLKADSIIAVSSGRVYP
jgi:hypothetical protein